MREVLSAIEEIRIRERLVGSRSFCTYLVEFFLNKTLQASGGTTEKAAYKTVVNILKSLRDNLPQIICIDLIGKKEGPS